MLQTNITERFLQNEQDINNIVLSVDQDIVGALILNPLIIIAALVVLLLIIIACTCFFIRRKRKRDEKMKIIPTDKEKGHKKHKKHHSKHHKDYEESDNSEFGSDLKD